MMTQSAAEWSRRRATDVSATDTLYSQICHASGGGIMLRPSLLWRELLLAKLARLQRRRLPSVGYQVVEWLLHVTTSGQGRHDPEVFPSLFVLEQTGLAEAVRDAHCRILALHSGVLPLSHGGSLGLTYLRLLHSRSSVFEVTKHGLKARPELFCMDSDQWPALLLPKDHLFSDFLPPGRIPDTTVRLERDGAVVRAFRRTIRLLQQHGARLSADWLSVVRTVAATHAMQLRHSFSCRTAYYGGIFVEHGARPVAAVAEDYLHEFYHQLLWGLWDLDEGRGIPDDSVTITSPITGRTRPLATMTQAVIIYAAAIQLLQGLSEGHSRDAIYARTRIAELRHKLPDLLSAIQRASTNYPRMRLLGELAASTQGS